MEEEAFDILWDYLESWGSVYDWKVVFVITFLVVSFELLFLELCRTCQKKSSKGNIQRESSSDSLEEEENPFLKNLGYENWPCTQLPPERRFGALSKNQLLSSLDPQNTEAIINEMLSGSYNTWSGTSESQLSWPSVSGSRLSFSSEAISSPSVLNLVQRKPPPNHGRFSHVMFESPLNSTSSRKLLPVRKMRVNKNKNVRFSSDHNFFRKSKITVENDDLDWTPCPSAHLYLPRNQIKLLEENLKNQIPSKSQPVLKIKTTYQSSSFAKLNQAPLYPFEKISHKRGKMTPESSFHSYDDNRSKIFVRSQASSQSEVSVQTEIPNQDQDSNQIQNNINIQTSVKVQGFSKFQNSYYEKQEQFTTNFLDQSPPILSLRSDEAVNPHLLNIMKNLNILNSKEELQECSVVPSTCVSISSQRKYKNEMCSTNLKSTMRPRIISLKAKKTPFSHLFNNPYYSTLATKRKLECNIGKTYSIYEMNLWNILPDSALRTLRVSVPNSYIGHYRGRTRVDKLGGTKIKPPSQGQNKKSPEKIYAQKTPQSLKNKCEFKKTADTCTLSSEYSDDKTQQSQDTDIIRANNKENICPPYTTKTEFLALEQVTPQTKYTHQTVLNSISPPKKFSFQVEKANKIHDTKKINYAIDPKTCEMSNLLGKKEPNKTNMYGYDCSRSGKRLKLQKTLHPRVVLKSFLCSIFAPLQSEKQKKREALGEDVDKIIQDQSQEAEVSLSKVKSEPLLDLKGGSSLQTAPSQEEESLIKAQQVECVGPRDCMTQTEYANQQECFTTNKEEQQDQNCLPITISKSQSDKSCIPSLKHTSEETLEKSKKSVCPPSFEEIEGSLESHIKTTDILQAIHTTFLSSPKIKIKYVKIMKDNNNSVCIPLICEEIKQSESKVETEIDSKCRNTTMSNPCPGTMDMQIMEDIKNVIPSPEIKNSEFCGINEIDSNLAKSNTDLKTTTAESVIDVNSSECCVPVCEEINLSLEKQPKSEDSSESNITSKPYSCSGENVKESVAYLVSENIPKSSDHISKSGDAPSDESNSLSLNCEEKVKKSLRTHKTTKNILESIFNFTPSQNSRKMKTVQGKADMNNLHSAVGQLSDSSISLPPEKKSIQTLEDVKKSVCSPICDEIIKSLESHITEAVSNSIDASAHSPCSIKKKSVEVILDLKKKLFSLPIPEETKKSLERYMKTRGVMEPRSTSIPVSLQKKISQFSPNVKKTAFSPPVCGEMQSSLEIRLKIPPKRNLEIDRKTEKLPKEDTLLVKEGHEQIMAHITEEMVSTHPGGRKKNFLKAGDNVVDGNVKSQLSSNSVLDRLTANEKANLIFHFHKKVLELIQGRIHKIVIESYQKLSSLIIPCISKEAHSDRRVFPRCRKLNFIPQEEVDSIEMNLKHKYLMFLFGLPFNNQNSFKKSIPKIITPISAMMYQKCKAKHIEKNMIVIKREVKEKLESHIREKQKLGFSNSLMCSPSQSFIPSLPKNICGPEEGKTVKSVISSLFIEDETRRSLPCHLEEMAAEQKGGIPSKLTKCENATKELFPVSSMNAVIVNKLNVTNYINKNIEQAVAVNMQLRLNQKSLYMPAENKRGSLPLVFQRFTTNDLKKLVIHFLVKTLEVKMNMIPGVVEESIKMVNNQVQRKSRLDSVYPTNKITKSRSTKLPFMEPNCLHQIILNLQHKYLMFLLGLPGEALSPTVAIPPRPKLNKKCKTVNDVGSQIHLSIDKEKLEEHMSFKKQNPYKVPPSIIKSLRSFTVSLWPSEDIPTVLDNRTNSGKNLSLNCSSTVLDFQCLTQKDSESSSRKHPEEEKLNDCFKTSPKINKTTPGPPKATLANIDSSVDSKVSDLQKVKGAEVNVDSDNLKAPFPKSKDSIQIEENVQGSVELKNSPPPSKEKEDIEMHFQTPTVIFRTFKKSWENVPLSEGGPVSQDQKEIYFDIPFKLEEFSSLNKFKTKQVKNKTKPVCQKGNLIPQNNQASAGQNSLISLPYYKTHQHRKRKLHPKINSPYLLSDSSLETQSMTNSLLREERLPRKTWSHLSYPLASLKDSSIRLRCKKSNEKIILSLDKKDEKKHNVELPKEKAMKMDHSCNFTETKKKQKIQEKVYDFDLENLEWHSLNKPKSNLKHQQENNNYFNFRRKNTQPFFYACTLADTPGNKSKTIRWNIPQNTSGHSKFRIPLVAKFSNPEKIWSSSKKFLESVSGPFNLCPVHQK
ncbi:leucine-rich repeat transmembrane protein CCDC168 [Macrotis lagotis]|uniref:leucine-rich repeat transmembrane protein CCDC168 n=1 Tax=Macrotis lagotis TaxID=92651 RepID=UPI003D680DC8